MSYTATQVYSAVGAQTRVDSANPHRLIQLLMEGALEKVAVAKGHMQRGEIPLKAKFISRAVSIVDGLRMSLDQSVDHEMTRNLADLYDYINRRLLHANITNEVAALDEVAGLLHELKEAWAAIPEELRSGRAHIKPVLDGNG